MNNLLKTPFRWYYLQKNLFPHYSVLAEEYLHHKQYPDSPWKLFCYDSGLLPFQFFIPQGVALPSDMNCDQWFVINFDNPGTIISLDAYRSNLVLFQNGEGLWWMFSGSPLADNLIPCGRWYSVLKLSSGRYIISETFDVVDLTRISKMCRLEWSNSCDTAGIIYHNGAYKNVIYLEGEPESLQSVIYEEGTENAEKQFIPAKTVYINQYAYADLMPEYMVEAINAIRVHRNTNITYRPGTSLSENYNLQLREVQTVWDTPKLALLTLKFEMDQVLDTAGCCTNEPLNALFPLRANPNSYKLRAGTITNVNISVLNNDTGYNLHVFVDDIDTYQGGKVFMAADGRFQYIPPFTGFIGSDSFFYTVFDGLGNSADALVSLVVDTVHSVNDHYNSSPFIRVLAYPASIGLLANDFLPVDYNISPVIYMAGGGLSQTIMSQQGDGNFIIVDNMTGAFEFHKVFTNPSGYNTFQYRIYVAPGILGTPSTVTIDYSL